MVLTPTPVGKTLLLTDNNVDLETHATEPPRKEIKDDNLPTIQDAEEESTPESEEETLLTLVDDIQDAEPERRLQSPQRQRRPPKTLRYDTYNQRLCWYGTGTKRILPALDCLKCTDNKIQRHTVNT